MKQVVVISNIKKVEKESNKWQKCESREGFRLGEVVYDQLGCIGYIICFLEGGQVRLNSNGCCDIMDLRKCPVNEALEDVKDLNRYYKEMSLKYPDKDFLKKNYKAKVVEDFKEEDRVYLNSKDFAQYQKNLLFYAKHEGYKKLKEYVRTSLTYLRFTFSQWRLVYSIILISKKGYLFPNAE